MALLEHGCGAGSEGALQPSLGKPMFMHACSLQSSEKTEITLTPVSDRLEVCTIQHQPCKRCGAGPCMAQSWLAASHDDGIAGSLSRKA